MHTSAIRNEDIRNLVEQTLTNDDEASRKLVAFVQAILDRLEGNIGNGFTDSTDMAQETAMRVWQRLDSFVGESVGEFCRWVAMIAKNVRADLFRFERRNCRDNRRLTEFNTDLLLEEIFVARDLGPSERVARAEQAAICQAALSHLNLERQNLVRLRLYDSCSWEEIAREKKKSIAACRRTYYRALEQWKMLIAREFNCDD